MNNHTVTPEGTVLESEFVGDRKPTVKTIRMVQGIAGQVAFETLVHYPGEGPHRVVFVGTHQSEAAPVVMWTPTFGQIFVDSPSRFGKFSRRWVERFYA